MKPDKTHPFRNEIICKPKDGSQSFPKKGDLRDLTALHKMEELKEKKQMEEDLWK